MKSRIYLAVQALLCTALCAALAFSAIGMYNEGRAAGEDCFSREKVSARLSALSPLFLAAALSSCAGLFIGAGTRKQMQADAEIVRDLIIRRRVSLSAEMRAEEKKQKKLRLAGIVGAAVCFVPAAVYLSVGSHFEGPDPEKVVGEALLHILPWTVIGLGFPAAAETLREKSLVREVRAAKALPKAEHAAYAGSVRGGEVSGNVFFVRAVLLVLGAGLLVHGIFNGSMRDVLTKAIHICTECIGLG